MDSEAGLEQFLSNPEFKAEEEEEVKGEKPHHPVEDSQASSVLLGNLNPQSP